MGMVLFLAIAGTLYQNLSLQKIGKALPSLIAADITNLIAGTSSQTYKELLLREEDFVTLAVTDAMGNVWLFFLVAGALNLVLAMFLGVSFVSVSFFLLNSICDKVLVTDAFLENKIEELGQCCIYTEGASASSVFRVMTVSVMYDVMSPFYLPSPSVFRLVFVLDRDIRMH